MRRTLILTIKYIPVLQLFTTVAYSALNATGYSTSGAIMALALGNNLILTAILLLCSVSFYFCVWHRVVIFVNILNTVIGFMPAEGFVQCPDEIILIVQGCVSVAGGTFALIYHKKHTA